MAPIGERERIGSLKEGDGFRGYVLPLSSGYRVLYAEKLS
jgi:hypothetical protein